MTLSDIKLFLRIDTNDDDSLIETLRLAAIQYIQEATGKQYDDNSELYNLLIKILVVHWYENREAIQDGNRTEAPHTITSLLNHIALVNNE